MGDIHLRHHLVVLLLSLLFSAEAFAQKDLMNPCERLLTLDSSTEIQLTTNQIAVDGLLSFYIREDGDQASTGHLVTDEWTRKNISPHTEDFARKIKTGDRIFILDHNGRVKTSGYFGELKEPKVVTMNGVTFQLIKKFIFLFKDVALTEPVTAPGELHQYFNKHFHAVVIQTLDEAELKELQERLGPSFARYEANKKSLDRVVRVGRRRAYELAHYQEGFTGKAEVKILKKNSKVMDMVTGKFSSTESYWQLQYKMTSMDPDAPSKISAKDYLILLDANGNVTAEGLIGSKEFPIWCDSAEKANAIDAKVKSAHSAFLAKVKLRKLD